MDKRDLRRYRSNKRELALIEKKIERLYERLENVPEISGKVTKSSDKFPYIEEHITVKMNEPKEAAMIKEQIRTEESKKKRILEKLQDVELFIATLPEGEDKQIFEMAYLEGVKQQDIAEVIGFERSNISKRIASILQLSHNSHFDMV